MPRKPINLFNARTVGAIKPPKSGQADYFDKELKGWGIRVSSTGRKTWFVMYRFNGRRERFTLGTYPTLGSKEARKEALAVLREVADKKNPAEEKRQKKMADSFEELAAAYVREYAQGKDFATWQDGKDICEASPGFELRGRKVITPPKYPSADLKKNRPAIVAYLKAPETPPATNKRSWRTDDGILRRDVLAEWGRRKAEDITRADVNRLLDKFSDRPIQGNRALEIIRKMYSWAIGQNRIRLDVNPCHEVKKRTDERQKTRYLSAEEIQTFWSMEGTKKRPAKINEASRIALRLILVTAQRPGEVLGLPWAELSTDWETSKEPAWTLPSERSKNGREHRIQLSPLAVDLLKEAKALAGDSDFAFPSPRGGKAPMMVSSLSHALGNSEHFGLETFTPHDLRRTASTLMIRRECGVTQFIRARILNHIDQSVTSKHYDPYDYDEEKREALNAWARRLGDIIEGCKTSATIVNLHGGA